MMAIAMPITQNVVFLKIFPFSAIHQIDDNANQITSSIFFDI
jgi:hypothetical protein